MNNKTIELNIDTLNSWYFALGNSEPKNHFSAKSILLIMQEIEAIILKNNLNNQENETPKDDANCQ